MPLEILWKCDLFKAKLMPVVMENNPSGGGLSRDVLAEARFPCAAEIHCDSRYPPN